ncbi:hypothetical protein HD597_001815 [Nonomuraea thailandensis]|uniref:Uncharacterized protein n=1 Tax=Nonomuraea thailandensis TaxID=1188745 RepID=A0A9X2GBP8_9ACTN|nr:hypothetical protein [Nonomuraea thailandensis]MCP2354795.1 hypothetical protein [Nonomuraea thailandensis]
MAAPGSREELTAVSRDDDLAPDHLAPAQRVEIAVDVVEAHRSDGVLDPALACRRRRAWSLAHRHLFE